jgi:hypothetical protein
MNSLTERDLFVLRTIDKRDRIGLYGVFETLVDGGLDRWKALRICCHIAPPHVQKRVMELMA